MCLDRKRENSWSDCTLLTLKGPSLTQHSMIYFYHRYEMPAIVRAEDVNPNSTEIGADNNNQTVDGGHQTGTTPQSTQFVISSRVTVTRRVEPHSATGDRHPDENETNGLVIPVTRISDDEGVDSSRNTPEQRSPQGENNRTRKLSSCSSTQVRIEGALTGQPVKKARVSRRSENPSSQLAGFLMRLLQFE